MCDLILEAFRRLYPGKEFCYAASIAYSDRFNDYNANVKMLGSRIEFGLSRKWETVNDEIKIGLLQELMLSLFKSKKNTTNIDLYNKFVQNLHIAVEKTESDPVLVESFNRVNDSYFDGMVEQPNLRFGNCSKTVFGVYNFHNDTIKFSTVLRNDYELLDYVMYHELLHKKLKFRHNNGRSFHHTSEFRRREREFANHAVVEQRLKRL
ncbi:MAG: hypothetical protein ABIG95_01625 [Candidatus Woesearchaeota archaeon]